jgi:hypothetical protein
MIAWTGLREFAYDESFLGRMFVDHQCRRPEVRSRVI